MTTPINRAWVDSPPTTEPYTFGLLSVASDLIESTGKWQVNGVEYFSDNCAQGGTVNGSCPIITPTAPLVATITTTPSAAVGDGDGYQVVRDTATTTRVVRIDVDPDVHEPITFNLNGPSPHTVQIPPGGYHVFDELADGSYTLNSVLTPCSPIAFSVPFTAGTDPFGACTSVSYDVEVSSDPASQATVRYRIVSTTTGEQFAESTVKPGQTQVHHLPPGPITIQYQTMTGVQIIAANVVAPGAPVTTVVNVPTGTSSHEKPTTEGLNLVTGGGPFTVYARAQCNAVGAFPDSDASATARRRVQVVEEREVERNFSRNFLGAPDPRYPLGAASPAVGIKQALGALEADAGTAYGFRPVFHAPRWTQPYFSDRELLQDVADTNGGNGNVPNSRGLLRTILASRIAFGIYFDNPFDPDDPPEAGFWLVATGSVRVYRTPIFVNETFDVPTNQRLAIAERTYAVDADCYRAAVLVSVTGEG